MKQNIPLTVLCANDVCQKTGQCIRHIKYKEARESELTLCLLNNSLLDVTTDGCEYVHIPRPVMVARGFRQMHGSVPRSASQGLWRSFPDCHSRRQYYRLMNGEVPLYPEQQQKILAFFDARGADTSLGFDVCEEIIE